LALFDYSSAQNLNSFSTSESVRKIRAKVYKKFLYLLGVGNSVKAF